MAKNRAAAEKFILSYIGKLTPGTKNAEIYKNKFSNMNDKQFDDFMTQLKNGDIKLSVILPNYSDESISIKNNLKIAEELGHDFFQRLWIEGKDDSPTYLTPIKYIILDLPLRRASQMLTKKISVPDHNKVVDAMSGQPTGDSKGARLSYPEAQICSAMGLEDSVVELMKFRGGDVKGHMALNSMLSKYGAANQKVLTQFASGVESTKTLKTFLTCCHLKNNL